MVQKHIIEGIAKAQTERVQEVMVLNEKFRNYNPKEGNLHFTPSLDPSHRGREV